MYTFVINRYVRKHIIILDSSNVNERLRKIEQTLHILYFSSRKHRSVYNQIRSLRFGRKDDILDSRNINVGIRNFWLCWSHRSNAPLRQHPGRRGRRRRRVPHAAGHAQERRQDAGRQGTDAGRQHIHVPDTGMYLYKEPLICQPFSDIGNLWWWYGNLWYGTKGVPK